MERLGLAEPQPEASTSAPAQHQHELQQQPLSAYRLEPELARACAQAASSSTGGAAQRKQGLHLAVLGHVDAGKSTLMGRLLHELG